MSCPWCKYQTGGKCAAKDCDFKELPYRRTDILARIRREADHVVEIRNKLADSHDVDEETITEDTALIMDLAAGINIMSKALQEDFGMSEDEVKKVVGVKKLSLMQKAKLASKMAQFKMMRRGRK